MLAPGTALLELATHAAHQTGCATVAELTLHAPLILTADQTRRLQITIEAPDETNRRQLSIHTRPEHPTNDTAWTRHATALLSPTPPTHTPTRLDTTWPPNNATPVNIDNLYEKLAETGYHYGPAFQGLQAVWRRDTELFAEVQLPQPQQDTAAQFAIHPALLDAALHPLLIDNNQTNQNHALQLPFTWTDVTIHSTAATTLRVHITTTSDAVSIVATDPYGGLVAEIGALISRPITIQQLPTANTPNLTGLLHLAWTETPLPDTCITTNLAVLGQDVLGLGLPLRTELETAEAGDTVPRH